MGTGVYDYYQPQDDAPFHLAPPAETSALALPEVVDEFYFDLPVHEDPIGEFPGESFNEVLNGDVGESPSEAFNEILNDNFGENLAGGLTNNLVENAGEPAELVSGPEPIQPSFPLACPRACGRDLRVSERPRRDGRDGRAPVLSRPR